MKKVSIVIPTFNEVDNVVALFRQMNEVTRPREFDFEYLFIDNQSTDGTFEALRELAKVHRNVKLILNETNVGHIRSPYYGLFQATGDAVILIAADFQDPPYLIGKFLDEWVKGFKVVLAVKKETSEPFFMRNIRKSYYSALNRLSQTKLVKNATGSGLFDRRAIEELRKLNEPYPYFRGLVVELGFQVSQVEFSQPPRRAGQTKNNIFTLLDIAILGLVNHAAVTIRWVTIFGFVTSFVSFLIAAGYLIAKLLNWDTFDVGLAPTLIGVFFFGSLQVFLIGLLGEYVANIQLRLKGLPLVIEKERVNFEDSTESGN